MSESDAEEKSKARSEETNAGCSLDRREPMSDRWAKRVWAVGSYEEIAPKYVAMGGHLVERTGVDSDDAVLDIGCGTGTVSITAARRGARVTGVDIQPALLEQARSNAEIAGRNISWREADATALPFETNSFDVILSNLGHMYGDPPDAAAQELLRVTRPGGRVGFTAWTPTSLYPSIAGVFTTVLSPEQLPDFSEPPFLWGDSGTVEKRLGNAVNDVQFETRSVQYPALSPEHFWQQTAANSGMFVEILDEIDTDDIPTLRNQVIETIEPYFDATQNAVELEYLLTTATVTATSE